jgi:RNA polymerase sigma factor (sigma-70 family)
MPDATDSELMRDYAERNSEAAFAELVRRHVNLVYSVSFRVTGNSTDAQDAAQAVFIVLARKAGGLRHRAVLTGWLYETARFTATQLVRNRARRQVREQEAYMQSTLNTPASDPLWRQVEPFLEEGMARLREGDRALLALRFFENKTAAETASLLGLNEWTTHKRTTRALEKLRKFFARRGVASTATAIASAISAHSIQAAPEGIGKIITAAAFSKGAVAGATSLSLAKGVLKIMAWSTAKTAGVSALVLGLCIYCVKQNQAQAGLRAENDALRQHLAQLKNANDDLEAQRQRAARLASAHIPPVSAPANSTKPGNLYDWMKGAHPNITRAQLDPFLKAHGRNASSLLAAFRTSGDKDLLKEAMAKYPNDPQVAFEAAINTSLAGDEKRQWIDNFAKDAPNNALPNYLSALNDLQSGQTNAALQELTSATGKQLEEYNANRVEDDVDAYVAAGYSLAEAKLLAGSQLMLPQLSQVKQAALAAVNIASGYFQSGDQQSGQAALQAAINIGQQYNSPSTPFEIDQLMGLAIQKIALSTMDPNAPYGDNGGTVQDQINQLTQQKQAISAISDQAIALYPQLTEQDWILLRDRQMMFGEQNAMQWVIAQYGGQNP